MGRSHLNIANIRWTIINLTHLATVILLFSTTASVSAQDYLLPGVASPDSWFFSVTPQLTAVSYNGSPSRNRLISSGVNVDMAYLEKGGITFSFEQSVLRRLSNQNGVITPNLEQQTSSVSLRYNFTPDSLSGTLTLSGGWIHAKNNDVTNETNGVDVLSPRLAFLNYAKTLYTDLNFAQSSYGESFIGNGGLRVTQWSPAIGVGFANHWLHLRGYLINLSNPTRSTNRSNTNALELQWSYYLSATPGISPNKIQLGLIGGERIYTVSGSDLYNFGDVQTGAASLTLQWTISTSTLLLVQAGHGRFETDHPVMQTIVEYTNDYLYAGITYDW